MPTNDASFLTDGCAADLEQYWGDTSQQRDWQQQVEEKLLKQRERITHRPELQCDLDVDADGDGPVRGGMWIFSREGHLDASPLRALLYRGSQQLEGGGGDPDAVKDEEHEWHVNYYNQLLINNKSIND